MKQPMWKKLACMGLIVTAAIVSGCGSGEKVAVVNFDAFDDVTGKLSFALAILNNNNDGIILTSLYGHNSCNTYVREIVGGQTPIKLLDEENAALENAKSKLKRTENNG